jgi:hypothetical protein
MIHPSVIHVCARLHAALVSAVSGRRDEGQTTAEYALVLLGAAAVALLVLAWATKTNRIGKLFDFVLDEVVGKIT